MCATPNEGSGNLPSDDGGRYCLGVWDGSAFEAIRGTTGGLLRAIVGGYRTTGVLHRDGITTPDKVLNSTAGGSTGVSTGGSLTPGNTYYATYAWYNAQGV